MPFDRCIAAALADQLITADEHDNFQTVYREFESDFRRAMPPHEASAEAARETFRYIEDTAAERRRQTFLSLAAREDIAKRLDDHFNPISRKADPFKGALGLYDRLQPGRKGFAVEQQHDFWRSQAQAELDGAYTTWARDMKGQRRNLPRLDNIVREAFGERSGDNAAEMLVAGWKRASEQLRQAFNRFGGHIGKLEDWGLPQGHNQLAIRKAGFENWAAAITPLLDRARMVDRATERPLDDAGLKAALEKAYTSIVTNGWADRDPTSRGAGALANRRDDHRFLHFKDADSWFAYQRQFGEGDPINAMLGHIEGMSRDVAHLQVLGPNPGATLGWVKNTLSKRAAKMDHGAREINGTGLISRTKDRISRRIDQLRGVSPATNANDMLDAMYANYTRSNAAPTHPIWADIVGDAHALLSAGQLGSASVTAVPSDLGFQRLTRGFNGLPEVKALASYAKQLDPTNPEHRMAAIRMGLGAQHYGQVLGQQGRYIGEIYGHKLAHWVNDRMLMASGLTPWTSAGRSAFGMDFLGHVADQAGKEFGDLDKNFAGALTRYGIGQAEWDTIRATEPWFAKWEEHAPGQEVSIGAPFIRPGDIMARTDLDQSHALALASKLADMVQSETEFAVPSASLRAKAEIYGTDHPGSVRWTIMQSVGMYRTFSAVLGLTHGRRLLGNVRPNPWKAGAYTASLILTSTLAGAAALQMREVIAGRDPRDMNDHRFWEAAFITGGGFGLLSDFVYAGLGGQSSSGQGIGSTIGGPMVGLVDDVKNTLLGTQGIGAAAHAPSATAKNLPTRLTEFAKRYLPGGNIWYAKLAIERFIWDQLQSQIDPGWKTRIARIERWYRRQYGNSYYWHHGDVSPERAPDPAAAVGGSP